MRTKTVAVETLNDRVATMVVNGGANSQGRIPTLGATLSAGVRFVNASPRNGYKKRPTAGLEVRPATGPMSKLPRYEQLLLGLTLGGLFLGGLFLGRPLGGLFLGGLLLRGFLLGRPLGGLLLRGLLLGRPLNGLLLRSFFGCHFRGS